MFWVVYRAVAAGVAFVPFIVGVLVLWFLPYSGDLGYGLWTLSFALLISAGYGALSIVIAEEARRRGYSWKLFFWLSIGLTPLLMGLIAPNLSKRATTDLVLPRVCIDCQKPLLPDAKFCSICGRLSPLLAKANYFQPDSSGGGPLIASIVSARTSNVLSGIVAILGSITLISLFFLDANVTQGFVVFGIQGFVPLATSGAGLAILGVILLVRALRSTAK